MRKGVFAMVATGAVLIAVLYAIASIPGAVRTGVADALPAVAAMYEKEIVEAVRQEISSERVADYIREALASGMSEMRQDFSPALREALEGGFSEMFTGDEGLSGELMDKIAKEAAGTLPGETELTAIVERIVREEVAGQMEGIRLDQDTFASIITGWLTQRLSP